MTVQASPSRSPSKSAGAAVGGVLLTLLIFVGVFLSFLVAPLLALLLAFLAFTVLRPRATHPGSSASGSSAGAEHAPHGFGAGTQ